MGDSAKWFWEIIAESRQGTGADDLDEQMDRLVDLLVRREVQEILEFQRLFETYIRDAYRWDLWAVAYIVNGGCSDDGFDYFLGWLIARGESHYTAALADPQRAADGVEPDNEVECEDMWCVARMAFEKKTGKDEEDFFQQVESVSRTIKGEPWDEDEVYEMYPELAQKFE